jgi:Ca2+-binding EF-hand superfamily protein
MRISMAGAGKALMAGLFPLSVAVAALTAGSAAQAQQKPPAATPAPAPAAPASTPPASTPPADPDALPQSLLEFDTNKDKIVEQKEFVTVQMKTFDEVDANKDGFVTREEYIKQAEPPFIAADAQNLPPIEERRRILNLRFTNLDSNQDGKISREEVEQSFVREFIIMDKDQNGRLTAADWRIAQQQAQQAQANRAPERITKQEFIDGENAVFERLDADKDKSLSLAEFLAIANSAPPASQEQVKARLTTAFAEIDTSNDKKLSLAEWQATSERNFANADRNKDGVLTGEELRPAAPPQAAAPVEETRAQFVNGRSDELLARLDANKDGKISLAEFLVLASEAPPAQAANAKAQLTGSFNNMDGNKNGTVERSELITHFTAIFSRVDANKDGKITQQEVNAMNSPPPAARPQSKPAAPTPARPPAAAPAPQAAPKPAPKPPAPAPAPQGGPPPAYPSGQAPITTTPGGQPLR